MTEQEWDAHDYNKQRRKGCLWFLTLGAVTLGALIALLSGRRR